MAEYDARHINGTVLGLLDGVAKDLYLTANEEIKRFPTIAALKNPLLREKELNRHYDFMRKILEEMRTTEEPALLIGIEYAILERDERTLTQLAKRHGVDQFLKSDITINQRCREAVGGALEALAYQAQNPAQFHEVMTIGCARKNFDARNLPIDVVRDATRTQANALRNDMKGLIQTDQERKRRDFLGRRHQNMLASETIYKSLQMDAKRNREASHGLF